MAKKIKCAGFLYALYVSSQFVEYFDSMESAKDFVDASVICRTSSDYFIKPVAFFTMVEEEEA
jgi:hypothetical protein